MSSRAEKERLKAQQEKFQAILSGLLKDDDNKYCVDCDAKGPRWASWNLGIFLCIRCAGIHRNLGVHISKVKSVNLDTWTPEQMAMMMEMGNSRARAVYEANIPDNYRRPQTDSALEAFIRSKYETKKYIAREWVPPKPSIPKELLEDDKDKKRSRPKATGTLQLASTPRSASSPNFTTPASAPEKKPETKPVQNTTPKPVEAPAPINKAASSNNTADLIGLDAPESSNNNLLGDLNDLIGGDLSGMAPTSGSDQPPSNNPSQVMNGGMEASLFPESTGNGGQNQSKSSKDSILALYGSGGQQQQQQFGVPGPNYMSPCDGPPMYSYTDTGGVYMPAQQQTMAPMYSGMQQPQQSMMSGTGNMPMQQSSMMGNQMGMPQGNMGMQQGSMGMQHGNMGMQQGSMGMQPGNMGMQQGNMGMPQQMGMYGQQQQMQQMQFQQMQNQMAAMRMGQAGPVASGVPQNGVPAGQGWGAPATGHTLKSNLWH